MWKSEDLFSLILVPFSNTKLAVNIHLLCKGNNIDWILQNKKICYLYVGNEVTEPKPVKLETYAIHKVKILC